MKKLTQQVLEAVRFDALAAAERITGEEYKVNSRTADLGFAMHIRHVRDTAELLKISGDTCYERDMEWTLKRFQEAGFEVMLTEDFEGDKGDDGTPFKEQFHILFDERRGLLLWLQTYSRGAKFNPNGSVNTATLYFNWRPTQGTHGLLGCSMQAVRDPGAVVSYAPDPYKPNAPSRRAHAYAGDVDAREGVFAWLEESEENGEFLPVWLAAPHMWLLTYMDSKSEGYDSDAINKARIAKLPAHVQAAIKGTK